jgi:hypothetical protein
MAGKSVTQRLFKSRFFDVMEDFLRPATVVNGNQTQMDQKVFAEP